MLVFTSSSNWFIWFPRSRLKWLNSPVKSTEYRRERELDNSEPTLIKDRKPERENKDDEVNHFSFSFCWEKVRVILFYIIDTETSSRKKDYVKMIRKMH